MLTKSVLVGRINYFLEQLTSLKIKNILEDIASTPSAELKNIVSEIRVACNTTSVQIDDVANGIKEVSAVISQHQWRVESMAITVGQQFGGEPLSSRVRAIHGVASIAGETKSDAQVVEMLSSYILKMDKTINDLKNEKVEDDARRKKELEEADKRQALFKEQMSLQQQRLEDALFKLEQAAKKSTSESKLQDQIDQLKEGQKLLMKDYEEQQHILAQRKYLQEQPPLWAFYQIIQMKLNEIMLAYKVLASGLIQADEKLQKTKFHNIIKLAGEAVPLPGVKLASSILNGVVNYMHRKKFQKKMVSGNEMCVTVTAMEKISEEVARSLSFQFEEQIRCITPRGIRLLGECGVRRMLEAMRIGITIPSALDSHTDARSMVDRMVEGTVLVETKHSVKLKNKKIETKSKDLNWTESGIFTKTGIRTLDERFFSGKTSRPDKYGYRLGDDKHASELGLDVMELHRQKSFVGAAPTLSPLKLQAEARGLIRQGAALRLVPAKVADSSSSSSSSASSSSSSSSSVPSTSTNSAQLRSSDPTSDRVKKVLFPEALKQVKTVPPIDEEIDHDDLDKLKLKGGGVRRGSDPSPAKSITRSTASFAAKSQGRVLPPLPKANAKPVVTAKVQRPRKGSSDNVFTPAASQSQQPVIRRGSNPDTNATSFAAAQPKQSRPATVSKPAVSIQPQPSDDKVLVDRTLLLNYESRIASLETKLEELSIIKIQMAEMKAMMELLVTAHSHSRPQSPPPRSRPQLPPLPGAIVSPTPSIPTSPMHSPLVVR